MTDQPNEPEKKIIIDEDWKTQVKTEQEEAARKAASQSAEGADERAGAAAADPSAGFEGPLPPASLPSLVTTLAMQAMVAMGLVPNPIDAKTQVQLEQARHLIDTIAMLEEKTQGNRTAEETSVIDNVLHELRMGYVSVKDRPVKTEGQA